MCYDLDSVHAVRAKVGTASYSSRCRSAIACFVGPLGSCRHCSIFHNAYTQCHHAATKSYTHIRSRQEGRHHVVSLSPYLDVSRRSFDLAFFTLHLLAFFLRARFLFCRRVGNPLGHVHASYFSRKTASMVSKQARHRKSHFKDSRHVGQTGESSPAALVSTSPPTM